MSNVESEETAMLPDIVVVPLIAVFLTIVDPVTRRVPVTLAFTSDMADGMSLLSH